MIREEVHCIIGIIDTHDVIHSRVIFENSDDEWTTHEDIWPIAGRGKRWRWWQHQSWGIEKSDINDSHLNTEDCERIENHLKKYNFDISDLCFYNFC